jgi:hypothetical protein
MQRTARLEAVFAELYLHLERTVAPNQPAVGVQMPLFWPLRRQDTP